MKRAIAIGVLVLAAMVSAVLLVGAIWERGGWRSVAIWTGGAAITAVIVWALSVVGDSKPNQGWF